MRPAARSMRSRTASARTIPRDATYSTCPASCSRAGSDHSRGLGGPRAMLVDDVARVPQHLAGRVRSAAALQRIQPLVDRLHYVVAVVEAVPQDEFQHGPGSPPGFAGKLFKSALLHGG